MCNEFEKLCWGHPEIIQLILGVGIGPCGTDRVGAQQMLFTLVCCINFAVSIRSYTFCFDRLKIKKTCVSLMLFWNVLLFRVAR